MVIIQKRNVFWSGGVDSTFIVTQLSMFPVTIRTFYIRGQTFRMSEPQELSAINEIRELLLSDSRTKAKILPIEIVNADDPRVKDREIVKAHRRIYMRLLEEYKEQRGGNLPPIGAQQIYADGAFISPQYVACASLAKYYGEPFEIGLLQDDFNGTVPALRETSTTTEYDDVACRNLLRVCEIGTDKDCYTLFKDFRFPIAGQKMYKRDGWQWYKDNEYEYIRAKTIFCQAPIIHTEGDYEPCGVCTACIGVIHEGVLEPFTEAGLERYRDYEENHEKEPERFKLKGL